MARYVGYMTDENGNKYYPNLHIGNLPKGDDTREYWASLQNGQYWYGNSGYVANMPASWGFVVKFGFTFGGDFSVLFFTQSAGAIYRKSGNASTVSGWVRIDSGSLAGKGVKTLSSGGNTGWVNQTDGDSYLITKAFIAFWNGRYSSTASNLTYCHQGEIQAKPTSLYDNSSGTTGTVSLSDSAANYKYLEIYSTRGSSDSMSNFVNKIYNPNGKNVTLGGPLPYQNDVYLYGKYINISGSSITVSKDRLVQIYQSGVNINNDDSHKIYKVLGWK